MSDLSKYLSCPPLQLADDLSSSGLTIKTTTATTWNDTAITSSLTTPYTPATLINDSKTEVEFILLETATLGNLTTTGATIYKRGLKYYAEGNSTDADEVTANKLPWTQGSTKLLIGTNPPYMYGRFPNKDNDETITGKWTFPATGSANEVVVSSAAVAPTADEALATKKYVDDTAIAGAPDATTTVKGIVEIATQAEVDAGDDTGGTTATVVVIPSTLSNVIQDGSYIYAADSVGTDAYAITLVPAVTAYVTGQMFNFKAGTANTAGATLNVNALGAKTIVKNYNTALTTGDILANQVIQVIYDGTNFQMASPSSGSPFTVGFGGTGVDGALNVTSGTTTLNLGQVYNYTTINVSVGATLAFTGTNDIAILNATGAVTLDGTVELRNKIYTNKVGKRTDKGDSLVSGSPLPTLTLSTGGTGGATNTTGGAGGTGGTSTTASGTPGAGGAAGGAGAAGSNGSGGNSSVGGGGGGGGGSTGASGTAGSTTATTAGGAGGAGGTAAAYGGSGGGGGAGYNTGNGGIGGAGGNGTTKGGTGGNGGASGASGGNGGNGGIGGQSSTSGQRGGDGGTGGDAYSTGGTGGAGNQHGGGTARGGDGGAGGNSFYGTGGTGGAGYVVPGATTGIGGYGGAGGKGRTGGNGGAGGDTTSSAPTSVGGRGGNGGAGVSGSAAFILYGASTISFTGTINAQGGDGGTGGVNGTGCSLRGGDGGDGGDGADVFLLSIGTMTNSGSCLNTGGEGGAGGAGASAGNYIPGYNGKDGLNGKTIICQVIQTL